MSPYLLTVHTLAGLSIIVSVVVTVMIMCLRESNKHAAEEAEKEEAELLGEMGSSDDELEGL